MPAPAPIILSYRYRLLPTKQQHAALARILEDQRQLYNACLAERIDAYQRSLLEVERHLRPKPHTDTAGGSSPDGDGSSPVSISARLRGPQASTPKRRGPRPRDTNQLALPLLSTPAIGAKSVADPRKAAKSARRISRLQTADRTSYRGVD